ncbi:MAG: ABC transporter ATP-binding protein [Acidimicrobiales bacterium]
MTLSVGQGEQLALLGPSGCGRPRCCAPSPGSSGRAAARSACAAPPSPVRRHVAPEQRRAGLVFQDWALFPHLSVGQNVAYGLPRSRRPRRGSRSADVDEALEMVGLAGFADRAPHTLSGGQQQRAALARALAPRPDALLLDEPFSNLDAAMRSEVRTEVHRLLVELGMTTVLVTHDQDEAFVLGDRVAVMHDGAIIQLGTPTEIYARPANRWVAGFVGEANFVPGQLAGTVVSTCIGSLPAPTTTLVEGEVDVLVRPEDFSITHGGDHIVELVEYYGHDTVYDVMIDHHLRVRIRQPSTPRHERGERVTVGTLGRPACVYPR